MQIDWKGKITESFYALGHAAVPVYLLDGKQPVLFEAGYSALARRYVREIAAVLGKRTPSHLLVTHAHFDHVGAAAYFRSAWPTMRIAASTKTRDVLDRPRVIQWIRSLNEQAVEAIRSWGVPDVDEIPFEPFAVDETMDDGQAIELESGIAIEVIACPGHTWDSVAYWIPEKGILIASEAVGCDDGTGYIVTEFLVDYDAYVRSMKKLAGLDIRILCTGHRLVLTDEDAGDYIHRSLDQAARYVAKVEKYLQAESGDTERVVSRVKADEWDPLPWPKQPEPAYVLNTRARVERVWERMQHQPVAEQDL
jgi:glyoxylase-like metal-dependent hydrolase (beta-lactamase superfamily II)